ncbi:predicted protein [Nematostella vectensis]|uniref:Small monomeric GTPase n=1 Tax=Nematostella vectensis TaxID=45351 RepID=A7SS29_NEMVE|nr:predicted protein [Nematostella vectensis]|eukprot:XP_001625584.1 predicted protein [Nematostella vectensis]
MKEKRNSLHEIAVFGGAGVGKTSIVKRFYCGKFSEEYEPTVEDCYSKVLNKNGSIMVLNTTDSSGSYQFPAMREVAIKRASGFILVYSLDSKFSFEELKRLLYEVIEKKKSADIPVVLVGNKKDLEEQREVSSEQVVKEVMAFAREKGCEGKLNMRQVETSAKDDCNISDVFDEVVDMLDKHPNKQEKQKK